MALTFGVGAARRSPAQAEPLTDESLPPFEQLDTLEYYLRWDHERFKSHHAWRLIPPANAELPPQHQKAFSLRLNINHRKQRLVLIYHEQMVTRDATHHTGKLTLSHAAYDELKTMLSEPVICQSQVSGRWVGPAPAYLRFDYGKRALRIFASENPQGPAGPGSEHKDRRFYLCNSVLKTWLEGQVKAILQKL